MTKTREDAFKNTDHGIIVIDKPEGLTSARAIYHLKKIPWVKKVGHTGTLDPFATGVMICGINQGTRLSQFFLKGDKTYVAELILGIETDTQDATGNIIAERFENVHRLTDQQISDTIKAFEGFQEQLPPVYSALKHHGVPLYKLARMGNPIQKPARSIHIKHIDILRIDKPSIWLEVSCSAGTYIRTLCADIGKKLMCGGHLKTLRRTESCGFTLKDAIPLSILNELDEEEKLKDKMIPMSTALKSMDEMIVDGEMEKRIKSGQPLGTPADNPLPKGPYMKIVTPNKELVAVVKYESGASYKYCCVFNH
ncbi:MAG: tRNA pseudouridine(55) synthase TruB [Proteobacteria bacterium]|nr:tRNA pseudouridine(55) synthase TruB [Pseudomonadota bacterium]